MSFKQHLEEALNPTFRDRSGRPKPKVATSKTDMIRDPMTGKPVDPSKVKEPKEDMEWVDEVVQTIVRKFGDRDLTQEEFKKAKELILKAINKAYREGVRSGKEIGRSEMRGAGEGTHGYGG